MRGFEVEKEKLGRNDDVVERDALAECLVPATLIRRCPHDGLSELFFGLGQSAAEAVLGAANDIVDAEIFCSELDDFGCAGEFAKGLLSRREARFFWADDGDIKKAANTRCFC